MSMVSEGGSEARVAKFARTHRQGSTAAISDRGWLVSVGTWHHPRIPLRDDTQGLLSLLEAEGATVLDALDGGYVVGWYDSRSATITVVPDHLGRLHVYYIEGQDGVYISTSATALSCTGPCSPRCMTIVLCLTEFVGLKGHVNSCFLAGDSLQPNLGPT
jgi:hypothetical protein